MYSEEVVIKFILYKLLCLFSGNKVGNILMLYLLLLCENKVAKRNGVHLGMSKELKPRIKPTLITF